VKKKILAKRPVQKPRPGGLVHAVMSAPMKPRPEPAPPTHEQAEIAMKIICSSANYTTLKQTAEDTIVRYLRADLSPVRTSGYAYIPQGGSISTTAGAVTWSGT
jgi:hypothetical protein